MLITIYFIKLINKMQEIKVGDIVETCNLMPGVVMKIDSDGGIEVRSFKYENNQYNGKSWSCCSLNHCGIVPLTLKQVETRLKLGYVQLSRICDLAQCDQDLYTKIVDGKVKVIIEYKLYKINFQTRIIEEISDWKRFGQFSCYTYKKALKMLKHLRTEEYSGYSIYRRYRINLNTSVC